MLHRVGQIRTYRRLRVEAEQQRIEVFAQFVRRVHRVVRLVVDPIGSFQVMKHTLPQLASLVLQQSLGNGTILKRQDARVAIETLSHQNVLQNHQKSQVALGLRPEE